MNKKNDAVELDSGAIPMNLHLPILTRQSFATAVGLSLDTVESMISRGYLPCLKIGKRSFINVALLQKRCLQQDFSL